MSVFKRYLKSILSNVFGLDVRLARSAPPSDSRRLASSLQTFEIDLVLDIGANSGQFAKGIRECGYAGKIVSFEPLSEAHKALSRASEGDSCWHAFPRCALGDREAEVEINIASNSESSSILPMLDAHLKAAPYSAYQATELVPLRTLDSVAQPYLVDARSPFLKIDTQGFEWQVLDGASHTLRCAKGVQVELSLTPLYDGQHLWREIIDRLEAEGFMLWAFKPVFSDPDSGQTLQVDGIFFRNPS